MKAYFFSSCHKLLFYIKQPLRDKIPFKKTQFHTNVSAYPYSLILENCKNIQTLKKTHTHVITTGLSNNNILAAKILALYAMLGNLDDANKIREHNSNAFLWNALIGVYARNECCHEALELYTKMRVFGIESDNFTYPLVLKACAGILGLKEGREIHCDIVKKGFELDVFVGVGIIDMYGKCGIFEDARQMFDKMSERDVVAWNAMISGCAQNGCSNEAFELFKEMQLADLRPNSSTLVGVLGVCDIVGGLERGQQIHGYVVKSGCECNAFLGTSLVELYAKCGDIEAAALVFEKMYEKSVVSWNAMISGYAQNGYANEALKLFYQMQFGDVELNSLTVVSVLLACAQLRALEEGKWIHDYAIRSGLELDVFVGTALIDMYSKCGRIDTARQLFDEMPRKNVVSWTAMIGGYSYHGYANEAFKLFNQMQLANVQPNSVTLVNMLLACTLLGVMQQGKSIHNYIVRRGFDLDVSMQNTLVDMYAKCGSIELSCGLFNKMPKRNLASWNVMVAAYRIHGLAKDALALFVQMQQIGIRPDHITFICVLSACSHAGLVDEGRRCFDSMTIEYCITPEMKHYACMVDLLGRSGHLDEAHDFIKKMPLEPDASVWGALLGACRIHNNIKLGEHAANCLIELKPDDAGYYVLLSNIYAAAGRWDSVMKVRTTMKDRGVKKSPGCSLVEINNRVYAFLVGDRSHPQLKKIYSFLEALAVQMKEAGYIPDTNFVLHDVEEEMKERMLCSHSERLAIAFGILNTSPGAPIRITKNLRVCGDCHTVTKFISKIVDRKVIVRDANRFHHFKDGYCSCGDYW
ncbi:pentatricopeptide repeat-containing protein At1g11290, chloroplastic [Cryptomeria japonica]|uniref:pentatricopeptide repeat-containing protein At1g11290, chloroplastic n=1 Tax=Cryptomeria japonica TaxID=3369 RepID=UPI0027DA4364|nr:pentatricopeptide repeat-containing protein At1g11290, chloroplastic [Cryptomeria japonica]